MSIIHIQHICKNYRQQRVIDDVTLEIKAGSFFGLIGANGAGKTTLIKCLLDFCEIDQGQIELFKLSHTDPLARAQLAFLPEHFTPPKHLTGKDFLIYMAKMHGHTYNATQVQAMCQTLDFTVMTLKQSVRDYSKGMAQKLGLMACLLSGKSLLILDEPMDGLDPKARAYFKRYLLQLKKQNVTLFFSTHLLADVETLCDQMAILHEGRLHFVGTPETCCTHFATADLEQAYLRCIGANRETHPVSTVSGVTSDFR